MRIGQAILLFILSVAILVSAVPAFSADASVRGLVVDQGDGLLWLGLPSAVKAGAVFDVKLLPTSEVIAKAEVIECTPDAPFVAKARYKKLDNAASIPIGAYVEGSADSISDGPEWVEAQGEEARAQSNPLSLRICTFYPNNDELRRETDDVWYSYALSYRLQDTAKYDSSIDVAYLRGDSSFIDKGEDARRDFRVIPIMWNMRMFGSDPSDGGWYTRFGLGLDFVKDSRRVGTDEDETSTTSLGWSLGFGYESRSGRIAELTYQDAARTDFNGIQFCLGTRF